MAIELDPIEQRVIGSLLEKERTVPDTYPMTLNGLRTACNQSSGRDPVLALEEHEVRQALDRLRPRGLTRVLHPSHGARMPKYRQVLDEVLTLDAGERAVVTLLLLRGPQTPGELRTRSERLHAFHQLTEVEAALGSLRERDEPLVRELDRRPGQKERRWVHLLGPVPEPSEPSPPVPAGPNELEALRAELAEARAEIARLQQELDDLTAPPG
ncbi:MAG: YceH family protein [Acidimicrobiales bacterium]